uniref:Uncharacterized protein n=1 Tax=Mycena chlorophos TaxID=658473 RepID=A0ABQ0KXZ9_MYCCL|nr:predicted protein [Mycena chlorophos]
MSLLGPGGLPAVPLLVTPLQGTFEVTSGSSGDSPSLSSKESRTKRSTSLPRGRGLEDRQGRRLRPRKIQNVDLARLPLLVIKSFFVVN